MMKPRLPIHLVWCLLTGCVALMGSPSWAAGDWPEFRGPTGQGTVSATNVPLYWNATSNVVWKTAIPGAGWSSPVLLNGRIYVTTATAEAGQTSLRALCLEATGGRILWNVVVLQPDPGAASALHQKNSL